MGFLVGISCSTASSSPRVNRSTGGEQLRPNTRVLSSIVYQATPKAPVILGGVILTMLCVGIVAALIHARRALAVDPMILLRDE